MSAATAGSRSTAPPPAAADPRKAPWFVHCPKRTGRRSERRASGSRRNCEAAHAAPHTLGAAVGWRRRKLALEIEDRSFRLSDHLAFPDREADSIAGFRARQRAAIGAERAAWAAAGELGA
jgi:hypothetical protein